MTNGDLYVTQFPQGIPDPVMRRITLECGPGDYIPFITTPVVNEIVHDLLAEREKKE